MSVSSLKSELDYIRTQDELVNSTSNETATPAPFTGNARSGSDEEKVIYEYQEKNNNSLDRRNTNHSNYSMNLSVKDIYGDLNSEEIKVQRQQTRNTIIAELVERTKEAEEDPYPSNNDFPDVNIPTNGEEFIDIDPELITWDGAEDPQDPRNWNLRTKIIMTGVVSLYALVSPMSSSMLSPAMTDIAEEFHITNPIIQSMVVSIQILAWALGPLIIAPLSENHRFGRKMVLDVSIWVSFFFNIGCAFSHSTAQMMIFRFVGGIFGSTPLNVGAGVLSDLFDADSRLISLAGFSLAPLLGPVIAPLIAGFIVSHKTWRWVFYVLCIFNGFTAILGTIFLKETYSPKLLRDKAIRLRKETSNENLHTIYEIADGETAIGKIWLSVNRPIKLLFTHPMVIGLGSYMAFVYGFMYLLIISFPQVFKSKYGFSTSQVGLMYIPMGVGFVLGVFFWTFAIGKVYQNLTDRNGGVAKPEFRLPCLISCGLIIPIGLIWYGWSAEKKLHWIMPGIGSAIFAFGLVCVFQSMQSYLIDMNVRFAASSVAAAALFRSLFGFTFPLFAAKMYARLNYGWGNTMCAFIGMLLGIPFPIFCYLYGEKLRNWANKRLELDQLKRDQRNLERLRKKQEK